MYSCVGYDRHCCAGCEKLLGLAGYPLTSLVVVLHELHRSNSRLSLLPAFVLLGLLKPLLPAVLTLEPL